MSLDPITISQDVIAQGVFALLAFLGGKAREVLSKLNTRKELFELTQKLAVQEALADAGITDVDQEKWLEAFLKSPDIEGVIGQILAAHITRSLDRYEQDIRNEVRTLLAVYREAEERKVTAFSNILTDALIRGCVEAVKVLDEASLLENFDKPDTRQYRMLMDSLQAIDKNLNLLVQLNRSQVEEYHELEHSYRGQVVTRHGTLMPPYVDEAKRFPIDEIYVPQRFARLIKPDEIIGEEQLLREAFRVAIIGQPGGGKSTFAANVAYKLAHYFDARRMGERQVTPIFVTLRDYGTRKKELGCSIVEFMEITAKTDYQIEPAEGAFRYWLTTGRVMVLFDGLDELLETHERRAITQDVEAFCNLYSTVPVIVTSREVGYEQAPLDERMFEVWRLTPFNDEQIEDYVTKWFAIQAGMTEPDRNKAIESFLNESKSVPDLQTNPLMLGLMCNIYRGQGYIPRNRPAVYEKCTEMLFERWDKHRGIQPNLPFEAHLRSTMMHLAHWIYSNESLQSGVTERQLVNQSAIYLLKKRHEDQSEAELAARSFVEFCRGRAWVFTDVGTTDDGDSLYQFTHRTFLEYFTAEYLTSIMITPEQLGNILLPKIAKREWDVVAQLAFKIMDRKIEDAGERLIERLIENIKDQDEIVLGRYLSFAARCLEFLVLPPALVRRLTEMCMTYCARRDAHKDGREVVDAEAMCRDVLQATASENLPVVIVALQAELIRLINEPDDFIALGAVQIIYSSGLIVLPELWKSNENLEQKIWENCQSRIIDLAMRYPSTATAMFVHRKIGLKEYIAWHGLSSVFSSQPLRLQPFNYASVVIQFISEVKPINELDEQSIKYLVENLEALYDGVRPDLKTFASSEIALMPSYSIITTGDLNVQISEKAAFMWFLLLAKKMQGQMESDKYYSQSTTHNLILARLQRLDESKWSKLLAECNFYPDDKELARQWIKGDISFNK